MPKTLGVVIGRFQIDDLQEGHKALLRSVQSNHSHMLVLIGTRDTPPTATNPLNVSVRDTMLRTFLGKQVKVSEIHDHPSNEIWSKNLDALLDAYKVSEQFSSIILYSGRDGFVPFYSGKYSVTVLNFGMDGISASNRRKEIANTNISHDKGPLFREGIIYAMEYLPHRIYLTVDIACTRHNPTIYGTRELLLAQRTHETDVWRFPGGFIEPGETFAAAARREFEEETGGWIESPEYVGDFNVDDWRLRGAKGVSHKTILMHSTFGWGPLSGADDIARVQWHPIQIVKNNVKKMLIPNHQRLFTDGLIPFLNNNYD